MKHRALLQKYMAKYETQQKVIEAALDNMENCADPMPALSREEELWLLIGKVRSACAVQKEGFKVLLETLNADRFREYVEQQKPLEFVLEYYYQQPLKDCTLTEVLDALVINGKVSNQMDSIDYSDDGDHYTLKMTHDLGINNSKMLRIAHESLFNTYDVRSDYVVSDRSLFVKIYKNI
ncbi:MAG TPA: hypothetical protein VMC84_09145 [Methanocella sp.]|uniref:hypothetical protein n=1 Tax=Methanocella sp. TaxID=2052833 RepID=UPI002BE6A313|nr:hypothetical protein [Methanocella sp.]HTY91328.1 hypothetical protein [Methanocella sp.]